MLSSWMLNESESGEMLFEKSEMGLFLDQRRSVYGDVKCPTALSLQQYATFMQ